MNRLLFVGGSVPHNLAIFLIVGLIIALQLSIRIERLLEEAYIQISNYWEACPRSHNQVALVLVISLMYIFFTAITTLIFPPVVTGSLLGAFPLLIFEANKWASSPYVSVSNIRVVRYPDRWFLFGPKDEESASGGVCVHVELKNEGRETAKGCAVNLRSSAVDDQGYRVRWTEGNSLEKDIAPNEVQEVDLFWIDYYDGILKTGDPQKSQSENHYPPGSYNWIPHREISEGEQAISIAVRGKNLTQREFKIQILGKKRIEPQSLFETAKDWGVIQRIKDYDDDYAIIYNRDREDDILEVPYDMQLTLLSEQGGQFSEQSVLGEEYYDYEAALDEKYELKER